jgi:hypothetical protein
LKQTNDRGLRRSHIAALRRATAPVAIDILERVVMPALHVGMPEKLRRSTRMTSATSAGIELFAFFVEVVPHKYQADDEGFFATIPHEQLTTPYADRNVLEIGRRLGRRQPGALHPDADRVRSREDAREVRRVRDVPAHDAGCTAAPRRRTHAAETAVARRRLPQCVSAARTTTLLFLLPLPG